jgi:hypothetical protein
MARGVERRRAAIACEERVVRPRRKRKLLAAFAAPPVDVATHTAHHHET